MRSSSVSSPAAASEIVPQSVVIPIEAGYSLQGYLFNPVKDTPRRLLLLSGGVGIPQRFFRSFASWLAAQGFTVLTYDYYGVAESAPASLRGLPTSASKWARQDMAGALAWLRSKHPGAPVALVAHSFGGQVAGMLPDHTDIKGLLMLGSATGSQHTYPLRTRLKHRIMWNILLPYYARTKGYLPGGVMGGAHIPAPAALEWRKWCFSRNYLMDSFGRSLPSEWNRYTEVRFPIVAYHASDDQIITEPGVRQLLSFYPNAPHTLHILHPGDFGLSSLGHVRFFRSELQAQLWPRLLADLKGFFAKEGKG
jgi:predicted alpha/beta hydrolase